MKNIKKNIAIIITLMLIILPMITMPVNAATIGKVYNLTSEMKGNTVYFNWSNVSNADGYDLYINTANRGFEYIGSVQNNNAPVIGFTEGVSYQAKVCAYQLTNTGKKEVGSFSDTIYVNMAVQETLGKVNTLTASQNGGNVTLNWSKVANVAGYQVFVNIPGTGYLNIGSVDGGATSAIITGFENGKYYQFKIRAYRKTSSGTLDYGAFSPERGLTIYKDQYQDNPVETKPEQVKNLNIGSISENTVTINWNNSANADGYEIYLDKGNGNFTYVDTVYRNYATLKNLDYNTYYRVKVISFKQGKNGIIRGDESEYKAFVTEAQTIQVDTVQNLTVQVEKNTAYLNWAKVNNANGYEIYMRQNNGTWQYMQTVYNNYATIRNLAYGTNYGVMVRAFQNTSNGTKYGYYSLEKRFTTPKEEITVGQVANVKATTSANNIYLNWSNIANASGYHIYLSKNRNYGYTLARTTSYASTTITGLEYGTTYYIKVYAYQYVNGVLKESPTATIVAITTARKNTLAAVTHLNSKVQNRNEAYLTWWSVEGAAGYEVYLSKNYGAYQKVKDVAQNYVTLFSDGSQTLDYNTNYRAKVVAYEYVNNQKVYAKDSNITSFKTESYNDYENNIYVSQVKNVRANVVKDAVYLSWDTIPGAAYYEIDFTVPGLGSVGPFITYTNSRTISGLTDKQYNYTARVRAYKWVNGKLVAGKYSDISAFTGK
ncbi:MAG: fibronectin type III domain-containing protein [Clostridia bacterium]|jgi:hypothetical protein|nr:fibronectin type III domain-containing protein [Clostridia bacterium]